MDSLSLQNSVVQSVLKTMYVLRNRSGITSILGVQVLLPVMPVQAETCVAPFRFVAHVLTKQKKSVEVQCS